MIVRERPRGLQLFYILRGSVLPHIAWELVTCTAVAALVTLTHGFVYQWKITLTTVPFSLIGLALAIFLGFRNNAAYDRYWEARKLWADLVHRARSFARAIQTLLHFETPAHIGDPADPRTRAVMRTIAFASALRHQLRETDPGPEMRRLLPPEEAAGFAACTLRHRLPAAAAGAGRRCLPARPPARCAGGGRHGPDAVGPGRRGRRLRAHQEHAHPLSLHLAAAPHGLAVLLPAALRAGGFGGFHDAVRGRHRGLHLLRPGRAGRRDRGALRDGRQPPAAGCPVPRDRSEPAGGARRDGVAAAAGAGGWATT